MKRSEIPVLPGWLTLPQAAERLGVTRQNVHRMIAGESLATIHRLGDTVKPIYVISIKEIEELMKARAAKIASTAELIKS